MVYLKENRCISCNKLHKRCIQNAISNCHLCNIFFINIMCFLLGNVFFKNLDYDLHESRSPELSFCRKLLSLYNSKSIQYPCHTVQIFPVGNMIY